jgi:hypothetical protein
MSRLFGLTAMVQVTRLCLCGANSNHLSFSHANSGCLLSRILVVSLHRVGSVLCLLVAFACLLPALRVEAFAMANKDNTFSPLLSSTRWCRDSEYLAQVERQHFKRQHSIAPVICSCTVYDYDESFHIRCSDVGHGKQDVHCYC